MTSAPRCRPRSQGPQKPKGEPMPSKGRIKKPRVPQLTFDLLQPRDDFHSAIGTWAMDGGIAELIDSGLLKYPPDSSGTQRDYLHRMIRPHLLAAAIDALTWAAGMNNYVMSRPERLKEMRELTDMRSQIHKFIDKLKADAELMQKFAVAQKRIDCFPD